MAMWSGEIIDYPQPFPIFGVGKETPVLVGDQNGLFHNCLVLWTYTGDAVTLTGHQGIIDIRQRQWTFWHHC